MPPKGVPSCYFEPNGWVAKELNDLHPVALSALDTEYDSEAPRSVFWAAGRFYSAALISLVFRGLDDGLAPSATKVAEAFNAAELPKKQGGLGWTHIHIRRLLLRYGVWDDFLSYRHTDNDSFLTWMEADGIRWCSAPKTKADS
jgi:hypothetical protein